jgi:hypothetical protein
MQLLLNLGLVVSKQTSKQISSSSIHSFESNVSCKQQYLWWETGRGVINRFNFLFVVLQQTFLCRMQQTNMGWLQGFLCFSGTKKHGVGAVAYFGIFDISPCCLFQQWSEAIVGLSAHFLS